MTPYRFSNGTTVRGRPGRPVAAPRASWRGPHVSKSGTGYTLIELVVAIGLFALVMTLASGGYLMMIATNRQAEALSTGINNLSFAIESMTRDIRTGSGYCATGCSSTSFSFTDAGGSKVTYGFSGGALTKNGAALTDPSVTVSSLTFYTSGLSSYTASGDRYQPNVTIVVSGSVSSGPGKTSSFTVESGATMRGTDI